MPRPRPKASLTLAYSLCPLLLAVSIFGFWECFGMPVGMLLGGDGLLYLAVGILPLVAFVVLAVRAAQRLEYNRLSPGYQMRMDHLQKRLNKLEDLLHVITNHNPEAITIFDKNNRYWFVNRSASKALGAEAEEITGKSVTKILGPDRARKLESHVNEVRSTGRSIEALDQLQDEHGQTHFVQMHYESIASFGDLQGGVIVREEEVTNLIVERERRVTMLRQVVATLLAVVDRRDPYAAGHSARVGQLSRVIAEEMVLDEKAITAAEIAGSLMNFGKVLVPREILTKTTILTPEELQMVRDSIMTSADILSIIDFDGPVVATLRQVLERYDGTGVPLGLKGDKIAATARVVTVASTYVALVSPRAHRPSMDFKDALQTMLADADKIYDRAVVKALVNYVENRPKKLDWLTTSNQN